MIAKDIAEFAWVVCASPDYLARRGRPQKPADLSTHACLVHSNALPDDHMWRFEGPKSGITVRVNGEMYSNSALALRKAAMAGLGIGLVPRYVVADDLAAGTLVSILNRFRVPSRMLHAIYPDAETTPAKIGIFVDFLTKWLVTRGIGLTA